MSDCFPGVVLSLAVILILFIAFVSGSVARRDVVKEGCNRIGAFQIDGNVYDCKPRGEAK